MCPILRSDPDQFPQNISQHVHYISENKTTETVQDFNVHFQPCILETIRMKRYDTKGAVLLCYPFPDSVIRKQMT